MSSTLSPKLTCMITPARLAVVPLCSLSTTSVTLSSTINCGATASAAAAAASVAAVSSRLTQQQRVTRSLYRATIRAARTYDMVPSQRVALIAEPAIRSWLPTRAIDWSLRDDTCVELVRRAFRSHTNNNNNNNTKANTNIATKQRNVGGAQNVGFAALRALSRHQSSINADHTTFQGKLIRLLEAETASLTDDQNTNDDDIDNDNDNDEMMHESSRHTYHDDDDHHITSSNNSMIAGAPLSIIGTVAHTRARSATYPYDHATTRSRPYHSVPLRAVPHDSLPAFASSSSSTPSHRNGSSAITMTSSPSSRVPMDDDEREWRRIKSMVLSQLLDQSNEVTQLPRNAYDDYDHHRHNNNNNHSRTSSVSLPLAQQFASAGIARAMNNNANNGSSLSSHDNHCNNTIRGEREFVRGAHMFSWHRPLRRISYDALLNVSIQERNVPLALAVLDVMSASQYRLSSSMQISLAEMFARSSHMIGALHVLRLSVWGQHARSLPPHTHNNSASASGGVSLSSVTASTHMNIDNLTITPRDVDPNDPVWLRVLNPVMFAVAQDASHNNELAHDLFNQCHTYGITPNRGTYEALLLSCYNARAPVAATRVLSAMKAAGLAPSLSCYNAVLHTCSFDGAATESFRLVSQMKADNVQPNVDTYFWTYQSAFKANDTQGMQMVLLAAKEQGLDPDAVSAGAGAGIKAL